MKTKCIIGILLLVFTFTLVPINYAFGDAYSVPGGPWIQSEQHISIEGLLSNEELGKKLHQIEARSKGRMTLDIAGFSDFGWPLYVAKIGTGDTKVMITTQIHGGEPLGTEAAVNIIQHLATSSNPDMEMIREQLTVWIMPRVNPDGAELFRRWNVLEWDPNEFGFPEDTPAPWYYAWYLPYFGLPPGYDVNRDFNPDLDYEVQADHLPGESWKPGFYVTPEARAIRDTFKLLKPVDVYIDIHHQGSYLIEDTNEQTMLSVIAKVCEGVSEEQFTLSKQVNVVAYQALSARGDSVFNTITRYPDVNLPGTALGTFALNDAAIMLFEVRGIGQKALGYRTQLDYVGVMAILNALATGELYEADPNLYYDIPHRQWLQPPHISEEDFDDFVIWE